MSNDKNKKDKEDQIDKKNEASSALRALNALLHENSHHDKHEHAHGRHRGHGHKHDDHDDKDGDGDDDDGGDTVTVTAPLVNVGPVAQADAVTGLEDNTVSGNVLADNGHGADSDVDGGVLSVVPQVLTTVNGGTVTLLADGNFVYTPALNYNGPDSFIYNVLDGQGGSATGTVSLTIVSVNDGPVTQADAVTGLEDNTVSGNVLVDNGHGADSDVDGGVLSVVPQVLTTVNGGTVTLLANGSFTYLPLAGYHGVDTFDYTLLDGQGGSVIGMVTLSLETNNIVGMLTDDALNGTALNDDMDALAGNDLVHAGAGNDTVLGGDGADALYGEEGQDTLVGGDKNDVLEGGAGDDILFGDAGADIVRGDLGVDILHGGAENDFLYGGDEADTLYGDSGNDTLYGDAGNDLLYAGEGDDSVSGGTDDDTLYGEAGSDILNGDTGNDTIYAGDGADVVYGADGNDVIYGGLGKDVLTGNAGHDVLYGDGDMDTLYGYDGNDLLVGGAGEDTLWGMVGADTFKFSTADMDGTINRIRDFKVSDGDKLDVADILVGFTQGVSHIADFVKFTGPNSAGDVSLSVDRDGTGGAYASVFVAKLSAPGGALDAQTLLDTGVLLV